MIDDGPIAYSSYQRSNPLFENPFLDPDPSLTGLSLDLLRTDYCAVDRLHPPLHEMHLYATLACLLALGYQTQGESLFQHMCHSR